MEEEAQAAEALAKAADLEAAKDYRAAKEAQAQAAKALAEAAGLEAAAKEAAAAAAVARAAVAAEARAAEARPSAKAAGKRRAVCSFCRTTTCVGDGWRLHACNTPACKQLWSDRCIGRYAGYSDIQKLCWKHARCMIHDTPACNDCAVACELIL